MYQLAITEAERMAAAFRGVEFWAAELVAGKDRESKLWGACIDVGRIMIYIREFDRRWCGESLCKMHAANLALIVNPRLAYE